MDNMIGIELIVSVAMALTNLFKKAVPVNVVPFITVLFSILLNLANAALFRSDLLLAGREGFIVGGIAAGLFVAADAVRRSDKTDLPTDRQ